MEIDILAKKLRKRILEASYKAKACHIGSALSCIDILIALCWGVMNPEDILVFSKASGVSALYSILAEKGIIPEDKTAYYLKNYPLPSREVPGIGVSMGSLGHGLPVAVGIALADRDRKVYCLMSDGEMDEGTTWESALFAAHHRLNNLIVIVDFNQHQAMGRTHEILRLEPLDKKWATFGWLASRINGHDFRSLFPIKNIPISDKPSCIIAHTIKGRGVSFMEDKTEWHYLNLTKSQYEKSIRENS